jgi:hypothetical protein
MVVVENGHLLTSSIQNRITDTYPYYTPPPNVFSTSHKLADKSDALWTSVKTLLEKGRQAFEGNESEAPWIRIASELLESVFERTSAAGILRVMDV